MFRKTVGIPKVGMVDKHFILGKVTMVIYPLHHMKFF